MHDEDGSKIGNNREYERFNRQFQDNMDRGVFRCLTAEEAQALYPQAKLCNRSDEAIK